MKSFFSKAAIVFALVASVGGCASMNQIHREVSTQNRQVEGELERSLVRPEPAVPRGPIVTDTPWVNAKPIPVEPTFPLAFQKVVVFREPIGVPIAVLAQRIEGETGIRVSYQSELVSGGAEPAGAPVASAPAGGSLPTLSQAVNALQLGGVQGPDIRTGVALDYAGSVKGLFDAVAAAVGGYWEFDAVANRVDIYRYKTKRYRIAQVDGVATTKGEMGQAQGGQGQQLSSGKVEQKHEVEQSAWTSIEEGVKRLLSGEGTYSINPPLGIVQVRDRPDRIEMVDAFISETNRMLARQVDIEVKVYRVMVRSDDIRGFNWQGFFQRFVDERYNVVLDTLGMVPVDAGQGLARTIFRINNTHQGQPQPFGGTQFFLDVLNKIGRASVVTETSVLTTNNTMAPVRIVRQQKYVAEASQALIGNTGGGAAVPSGVTLKAGDIETGLVMYLIPHIQDDGRRVLLKMMATLSTLERLETFTVEGSSIQLPTVASREFAMTSWLNSGEVMVLAGFQSVDANQETASPLDESVWALAGRRENSREREMVMVTVRPLVMAAESRL